MADLLYSVTVFKNNAGRYGIKHPSGYIHSKDFASVWYCIKFVHKQGWFVREVRLNTPKALKAA